MIDDFDYVWSGKFDFFFLAIYYFICVYVGKECVYHAAHTRVRRIFQFLLSTGWISSCIISHCHLLQFGGIQGIAFLSCCSQSFFELPETELKAFMLQDLLAS